MRSRPALIAVFAALSVLTTVGVGLAPDKASAASTSSRFTAYIDAGDAAGVAALGKRIGIRIGLGSDYFDDRSWSAINDTWNMDNWAGRGYRMIWGVPMLPRSGASLTTGASGAYDQYFVNVAKSLVARGMGNAVLRLGWEFNQTSYAWYAAGQASAFVEYWRHIVKAMRGVAGAAFMFEWNPSMGDNGGGDKAMGDLTAYYPGDGYVDIVALDVYDIAWNSYPGEAAQFASIKSRKWGLDWLASFAGQHGKPLAIAEFGLGWGGSAGNGAPYSGSGVVSGGDNPRFVADMAAWMRNHDAVISGYWDKDFSSVENGRNPMTATEIAKQFGATATTTTKHRNHSKALGSRLTLHRVAATAKAVKISGRLLPVRAGKLVTIQTKGSAPTARWHAKQRVLTQADGRYHATIARHSRHHVRAVAHVRHHLERSHAITVG